MDSSLQSAHPSVDELNKTITPNAEEVEETEEEHHIHLPNPSLWPFILSAAILLTIMGLIALPSIPWLSIVAAPFILVGIMGWALEDPMAKQKDEYITVPFHPGSKFGIGQEVVDEKGAWLGTVQARFDNYILVESGDFFGGRPYYVPHSVISDNMKDDVIRLTVSEAELYNQGLTSVPDDLYNETPEPGVPQVVGVPLFARGPLSPAETGHYNYGPNYPGINTDASGSYINEEISPVPQKYVADRRRLLASSRTLPSRAVSPD